MPQQLYLHIGDCKTGSTVIQNMLAQGHVTPERRRLFYPGQVAHGRLVTSLGRRSDIYPKPWALAAKRLAGADWDVAVLSSELFEFANPAKVGAAIRENLPEYAGTLKVVAYIRPHVSRALSQFAENLKLGHSTGDMREFVEHFLKVGRLNYADRLALWRAEFGTRLIVRPFHRDFLTGGDVRRDFLHQILGGEKFALQDGQNDNASLGVGDLALMRLLQRRFEAAEVPMDNRVSFGKLFGRLLHARPPAYPLERLQMPRALYRRIADHCALDAGEMDKEWIGRPCFAPALEQAGNAVPDQAQSLEAGEYHTPETLRQSEAWADLILRQMGDAPSDFIKRLRPNQPVP